MDLGPPLCPAFNRGGRSGMDISFRRAPGHTWCHPIGPQVPSRTCHLIARHSWMSSSTKCTCPTCSWRSITAFSPRCQSFTLATHDQPFMATFTSHHLQSLASTSLIRMLWPPSSTTSSQVARCPFIIG
jgi:hypothetical protein